MGWKRGISWDCSFGKKTTGINMNTSKASIADFDKEYGLSDLLPFPLLEDIGSQLPHGIFSLLYPDGEPYYPDRPFSADLPAALRTFLKSQAVDFSGSFTCGTETITVFAVTHEMEVIGYLAFSPVAGQKRWDSIGFFIHRVLVHLMRLRYEGLLTSRLHGQVVEESYLELQQKVAQLEESERKYRNLAANLETEVEKKTKEIERAQAQLLLAEKLASLGRLAAGMAHEINNPVGFVKSNLGTLDDYGKDLLDLLGRYQPVERFMSERPDILAEEGIGRILEEIKSRKQEIDLPFVLEDFEKVIHDSLQGVERIARIVRDLKDFAHLDQAGLEWADVNRGIKSTVNVLSGEIKKKADIVLSLGELPSIRCYPQQINQVFMNILVNAVQAIDDRGKIEISTRAEQELVEVRFGDNGCGIRPEVLPKVFDPFFTTKDVGEGTGLGLNVAYNIVKSHGGSLSIESRMGKGTRVTVRLPVKGLQIQTSNDHQR
jgi:two-component system NtrC family sensor kinase